MNGQLGEFLSQLLKTLMFRQGRLHRGHFDRRHIARLVFALVPALELVKGRFVRPLGLDTEFAPFHAGDGVDFAEDFLAAWFAFHAEYLYS